MKQVMLILHGFLPHN